MEPDKDVWYWLAIVVSVIAMFVWALTTAVPIGDAWVPWAAIGVIVLAIGSVGVRAGLKARSVVKSIVWTPELKADYRRGAMQRSRRQLLEMIPPSVFVLGNFIVLNLRRADVISSWLGTLLFLALIVAWIWLRRIIRQSRAWKDTRDV